MGRLALLLGVLVLAAPAAALAGGHQQAALPVRGVLISGQSLGGISLGDSTQAEVVYGFALTAPGRPVCL
jgi:hypothetical protein